MSYRKIKIAWLCIPLGWPGGGTQRHLSNWAKFIDYDRFDVTLVFSVNDVQQTRLVKRHFESFSPLRVIPMHKLGPISRWFTGGLDPLRQTLESISPDILHSVFIQSDIAGSLVQSRIKLRAHVSSLEGPLVLLPFSNPLKLYFYKLIYRLVRDKIDKIVSISKATADEAVRQFGARLNRMQVIHSGVDLEEFQFKDGWPYIAAECPRVVGMIGRLSVEKIPDLVIRAAPIVLKRFPDVRFVFVGSGPEEQRLKSLTRQIGVTERFEFKGRSDFVSSILQTLDVFVFTSLYEGLPWVVLEAQAVGVPTIASSVAGVPEVILDGKTGLLLKNNSPEELAEKIVWMLEHREQAAEMGRAGRLAIETDFNIAREISDLQNLYEELVFAGKHSVCS